jgi:hypothetical protein
VKRKPAGSRKIIIICGITVKYTPKNKKGFMTECFFGCGGRVVVKFSQSVYMGNAQKLQVTRFKETYLDAPTLIVIIT